MKNCVYILECRNGRYYVGSAEDLTSRLVQHWKGLVKATMHLRPLKLVFWQSFPLVQEARRIEFKIKKLKNRAILERIIRDGKIQMELSR